VAAQLAAAESGALVAPDVALDSPEPADDAVAASGGPRPKKK
jgi:hypothetical protein